MKWIHNACAEVGRDPDTLDITVGVQVAFPDLGPTNHMTENPLSGTAETLAHAFRDYAAAGTAHLILHVTPSGLPAVERIVEATLLYKSTVS